MRSESGSDDDLYCFAGHLIGVAADDEEVRCDVRRVYRHALLSAPAEPDQRLVIKVQNGHFHLHRWRRGEENLALSSLRAPSLRVVEEEINNAALEGLNEYLLIHGGAVAADGEAVLLPGASGCGKSSLTAKLVSVGLGFLTDELTILAPTTAMVHPFPKAITLKGRSAALFDGLGQRVGGTSPGEEVDYLDPDVLRPGSVVEVARPIGYVVFPGYESDTITRLAGLTTGQTVLSLFENCCNMGIHKENGLDLLIGIARRAGGYRLSFNDLDKAGRLVSELVGAGRPLERAIANEVSVAGAASRPPIESPDPRDLTLMNGAHGQTAARTPPPQRREGLVERELPGELILYDPESDRAFLLNHVSAAIWDLCNGERTQRQIVDQLAEGFGAPLAEISPDVSHTIRRLRGDGLLA